MVNTVHDVEMMFKIDIFSTLKSLKLITKDALTIKFHDINFRLNTVIPSFPDTKLANINNDILIILNIAPLKIWSLQWVTNSNKYGTLVKY